MVGSSAAIEGWVRISIKKGMMPAPMCLAWWVLNAAYVAAVAVRMDVPVGGGGGGGLGGGGIGVVGGGGGADGGTDGGAGGCGGGFGGCGGGWDRGVCPV